MRQIANKIIEIDAGRPTVFPGDYDAYVYRKQTRPHNGSGPVSSGVIGADSGRSTARRHSGRPLSVEEEQRRLLAREARRLAVRIEGINVSLSGHETQIAELEAMFSRPGQFDGPAQLALAGEQHRMLKEEAGSLWVEWERLSLEAENIDSKLAELKTQ